MSAALRRFCLNLAAGLQFITLQRQATHLVQPSIKQSLALFVLATGIQLLQELHAVGLDGQLHPNGISYVASDVFWLLLTGWAATKAADREELAIRAITALASINAITALMFCYMALLPATTWQVLDEFARPVWYLPLVWQGIASIVALVRSCELLPEQRMGAILAVCFLFWLPGFTIEGDSYLWMPDYSEESDDGSAKRWEKARNESMLYTQPALLEKSLASIQADNNNLAPQLYVVSVAGYGEQDVFMREVLKVNAFFDQAFNTQGRSIALVNNPATVSDYPLATVTSLEKTLETIGSRMDRSRDVLLLFMTSHGAADFNFSLSLWPYSMNRLDPETLARMLDKAGIQNRVLIISACYSGGFVPKLANDHTLVMSASREDRNSHGCSHEAEWTFFGKAYFEEALGQTRDFVAAFELAKTSIHAREEEEKLKHSEPQISIGKDIPPVLQALVEALPPRPVAATFPPAISVTTTGTAVGNY